MNWLRENYFYTCYSRLLLSYLTLRNFISLFVMIIILKTKLKIYLIKTYNLVGLLQVVYLTCWQLTGQLQVHWSDKLHKATLHSMLQFSTTGRLFKSYVIITLAHLRTQGSHSDNVLVQATRNDCQNWSDCQWIRKNLESRFKYTVQVHMIIWQLIKLSVVTVLGRDRCCKWCYNIAQA